MFLTDIILKKRPLGDKGLKDVEIMLFYLKSVSNIL
jgi:hypothetical protein